MTLHAVHFLEWAKTHTRATYELTLSGVPPVEPTEFPFAADEVDIKVTGTYGHPVLLERIASRYGVHPTWVLPVTGTSTANFMALAIAADRGGPLLVEFPVYQPLMRAAEFLRLQTVSLTRDPRRHFAPDPDVVEQALRQGVTAVLLTDLHNPSGRLCPPETLAAIARLCDRYSAILIVDEVYRDFAHLNGGIPRTTAATLGDQVLTTNSLTKVYGLGGLRAGWLIAAPPWIALASRILDILCVDVPAPTASLAIRALENLERFEQRTRGIYRECAPIVTQWLESRRDVGGYGLDGAVFAYLGLPAGVDADEFTWFLRETFDTQVVSGAFFGEPDHIRVGFGVPPDRLREGLRRIGLALDRFASGRVGEPGSGPRR